MAATSFSPTLLSGKRVPLAEIDAAVSTRLGPTRGLRNSQPACFNRQVAMYLAHRVRRWSTKIIGRYYCGRDHSTVCYAIQRIENMRESDPDLDALLADLKRHLFAGHVPVRPTATGTSCTISLSHTQLDSLADLIAERVYNLGFKNPTCKENEPCEDVAKHATHSA